MKPKLFQWQLAHGEAFIFGRSDWQYVLNTFCFGYNVGYRFIRSNKGVCNGNFLGIGADGCCTGLAVEQSARYGLLITNGEFVAFRGDNPTMIRVGPEHDGSVRFVNCAFWGPCHQIAELEGNGTVSFSDCNFCQWDAKKEGKAAIQVGGGTVLVRGCDFQQSKRQILLDRQAQGAVVSGNVVRGTLQIDNRGDAKLEVLGNLERK